MFHLNKGSSRKRASQKTADPLYVNEVSEEQKRQKRLEKNREIAKNCRKRKKEKKELLEEEVLHPSLLTNRSNA